MLKKIHTSNLTLGMYVEQLDRPWLETSFPLQGVHLCSMDEIDELRQRCEYVYIQVKERSVRDPDRGGARGARGISELGGNNVSSASGQGVESAYTDLRQFEQEVSEAKEIRHQAKVLVDTMHDDVRMGRSIDAQGAKMLVERMTDSIIRQPDALLWMAQLKNKDEYTAQHSLNVCILSLAFGHHLDFEREALNRLGLGGLLHDIGKIRVPRDVLNKPGKLNRQEFELMKKHPEDGLDILLNTRSLPREVVDVAFSHHERMAGQGYPRGLHGKAISLNSKLVAIVDVYDALTSDRAYHQGIASPTAMKLLFQGQRKDFEPELIDQFIKCVGIFPSGSLVELNSGEVGIVIPSGRKQRFKPIIMLILDKNKNKYFPLRILDYKFFEDRSPEHEVKQVLSSGAFGIDTSDYAKEIAAVR